MTKSLRKDFQREIKRSLSRFISIMLIVALGVAFYSGVRSTMPAMHMTADAVYDEENLMDIRVVGTLGLTEDDLAALSAVEGVKEAEGSHTTDFLCFVNTKEIVTRAISMPKDINKIKLVDGKYPEKYTDCLVSKEFMEESGLDIGDALTLATGDEESDIYDTLRAKNYRIVGVCSSSQYLNGEVGTTNVGDGMGDGYIVIPDEAYLLDVYTSIYLTVEGAAGLNCYDDEYKELVGSVVDKIEEIAQTQCDIRYTEIRSESSAALTQARNKYAASQILVQQEIQGAADQLAEQEMLIEQSKAEISNNLTLLQNAEANLPVYQQKVTEAEQTIATSEQQLAAAKKALEENRGELDDAIAQLEALKNDPNASAEDVQTATALATGIQVVVDRMEAEIASGEQQIEQGKSELLKAKVTLSQLQAAVANKGTLIDAEQEVLSADQLLQEAKQEYEAFKAEALEELAEAEEELTEVERQINEMEAPVWRVLDRESIEAYVSYITDSDSIGAIGTVFPMIFFLVAALVSLTTMTRMVEEERMQIGTLKALGYSKLSIASKYLLYAILASALGSIIGVIVGELTIPPLIIKAYRAVYYNLGENVIGLNAFDAVSAGLVATLFTTLGAFLACFKSLRSVPSELMRPEAPKAGKRTFIEGFAFIWQRLNFGQKSAFRNLFRYKKRFFMTLFGVGGCMALLLVGLGIRDSVTAMTEHQYGDVFSYSGIVSVDPGISRAERRTMLTNISNLQGIEGYIQANRTMVSASHNPESEIEDEKRAYLVVPTDVDEFPDYVKLQERTGDRDELNLLSDGVLITEKYADLLGVEVNDYIYLRLNDSTVATKEVKVLGITENYIFNYIYMTPSLYQTLYGVEPEINILMVKIYEGAPVPALKTMLTAVDGVNSVITNEDELEGINQVINNLTFIIVLMVISAAILAFVVLYNLNNINISERRRELATLKLLGFYDKELASYVYRENIILTLLGIILGMGMGVLLHRFVMITVETDVYMFGRELNFSSFLIATILTVIFTAIVNALMFKKLKKIDMVESLKSVE